MTCKILNLPCEYKKSPTHSRSFLRALQRRCSNGGRPRPRDGRSGFGDVCGFCSDVGAAVDEVSDVMDALSRDDCRFLVTLDDDERVTTAVTCQESAPTA